MPQLIWEKVEDRTFETGLDKGVLYLEDGSAVPWNGLTSVVKKSDKTSSPVYFDGMKINNLVSLGDFAATLKAITYPDEFVELEGMGSVRNGMFLDDQALKTFNLSYRVKVGNAIEGDSLGYKIHVVYNLVAIPSDKTNSTQSADPTLVEFEWELLAVPVEIPGFRPTAHLIIDSRDFDPWLLEDIEEKLYGGEFVDPLLPSMEDLVSYIDNWYRWKVIDNGDGTYTLISGRGDSLIFSGTNLEIFTALGIYVIDHGDGTFTVHDTYDIADVPEIKITDNGDGTWTATTSFDNLFGVDSEGFFQIFNANAVMIAPDEYRLSDTTAG